MVSDADPAEGPATTLHEVSAHLREILIRASDTESRWGYFAVLQLRWVLLVKEGIETRFFDDGARVEKLVVSAANRYLVALGKYVNGDKPRESWQMALGSATVWWPLVVQHLAVGSNALVNLDLGIAAAEAAPGEKLAALEDDFDRLIGMLHDLCHRAATELGEVSPWLGALRRIGGRRRGVLVRLAWNRARNEAWRLAEQLAPVPVLGWRDPIAERDTSTAELASEILDPGPFLRWGLLLIRTRESNDVRQVIEALMRLPGPSLAEVENGRHQLRGE